MADSTPHTPPAHQTESTVQQPAYTHKASAATPAHLHNLEQLFQQAPAFVAILMGPNGVVSWYNKCFAELWGTRDIMGKPMRKAWPELEGQGYCEMMEQVFRTGKPIYHNERRAMIRRHNDSKLSEAFFNFVYYPYSDEAGKIVGIMIHGMEVTDLVRARQEAESSEERLALALEASGMGIWEWNVLTGGLTWSDRLKEMYGFRSEDTVTYEQYISRIHPDDRAAKEATIQESMKTGSAYRQEHRVILPDGSIRWVMGHGKTFIEDGKPVRMLGTSLDIDEIKQAEQWLMESEERFRTMADTAPVLIWVSDKDKECTYLNQPWLEFTGRSYDEELGNGWAQGLHPDDYNRAMEVYGSAFDKRKPFSMEYRLRRADGVYRWMLDRGVPRFSRDGTFMGYIGSCVDIEDSKRGKELARMNAALKKQRAQLLALNNAKEEFISIASHQLRTPATSVKQYVGMLLQGYVGELADKQRDMLQTAFDSNERQLQIVDDLLKVARVDAGKVHLNKQRCDIRQLLEGIIRDQRIKSDERKQRIIFKKLASKSELQVDQGLIRMAFENLIDNASKYSGNDTTVTITLFHEGEHMCVTIQDQGVGISPADQKKLFQKFARITNALSAMVDGTGLGLYWTREIIMLHKGTITVESVVGKGSAFTVRLPL